MFDSSAVCKSSSIAAQAYHRKVQAVLELGPERCHRLIEGLGKAGIFVACCRAELQMGQPRSSMLLFMHE
jgi:hypothetical protein